MPFTSTADAQMLDALSNQSGAAPTNIVAFASLHTAYSATGLNELSGGSPAYARKAITWSAASSGTKSSSNSPVFDIAPGSTVAFVGLWSAATSGTFAGMGANGGASSVAFTAAATTDVITAPGSTYTNGQTVVVWPGAGATLPAGLTAGTVYYVVSASGATVKLATVAGGTAIDLTADGAGIIQAITVESYGGQGTFTLSTDTLTIS
jgi:hypothetical protein